MEEEEKRKRGPERSRMRLLSRRWIRVGHSFRGQLIIVLVFLIFTLHVITQKQASPEDTRNDTQRIVQSNPKEHPGSEITLPPPPPDLSNPPHQITHGDWVEAKGSNRDFFLYSAYLHRQQASSLVIIVAIVKKRRKSQVTSCAVWTDRTPSTVRATVKIIHEGWNLLYTAAFIHCTVPKDSHPTHVALSPYPGTLIPVEDLSARKHMGRMSVCVKPLHYKYDRALWLVEFIEFYRLLGADRFIFYNHTMGPSIEAVVRHYMKEDVVTLLPWALPVVSQKEIRTEGIFAALNDCSLRSVNRFTYSALVDFDEFLIPRKHDTLLELFDSYDKEYSAYMFQNVFFYLYWENDTAAAYDKLRQEGVSAVQGPGEPYLLTAFKTRRISTPHKHFVRSKYVVRPDRVMEVGNHQVWVYIGMKSVKTVPPTDGLSHHYRICEYGGFDCLKKPSHVDRTTHTWLARVYQKVLNQCSKIFPDDGFCPPAPALGSPW